MTTSKRTKEIRYFDRSKNCEVVRTVEIPAPLKVRDLASGAEVQEISSMDEMREIWATNILQDVMTPLTHQTRQLLAEELKKALLKPDEAAAIEHLSASWQCDDDRVLRLLGRLIGEVQEQRGQRGRGMVEKERLLHEKHIWEEDRKRLKDEVKALHEDVTKLVRERDAARRRGDSKFEMTSALTKERDELTKKLAHAEEALGRVLVQKNEMVKEYETLRRTTATEVEAALTDYESTVMEKLGAVAADHKVAVEANRELSKTNQELRELVTRYRALVADNEQAKVNKESIMNETKQTTTEPEVLRSGDEVHCKISGEGPFVLVTQVEEGIVKYANPVPGTKNHFHAGEVPIDRPWLVRDRAGAMQCLPAAILTKQVPKRTFSFGGAKAFVTSDVTAKLFQAAIWIAMLTLLYLQNSSN